jgi:cellulose synthase/poly-beta-1,6-N-acetylglucosamine synthase-like glycosyltransferase
MSRIGEMLLDRRLIGAEQLADALRVARRWRVRLGDVLVARGDVPADDFRRTLALHLQLPYVDLREQPPDVTLLRGCRFAQLAALQAVPWREVDGRVTLVTSDPRPELEAFARRHYGADGYALAMASPFDVLRTLQQLYRSELSHDSRLGLYERAPEFSARIVFSDGQLAWLLALATVLLALMFVWPTPTLIGLNFGVSLLCSLSFMLRALLTWSGSSRVASRKVTRAEVRALKDADCPVYSVLVPMYKEPAVLPILVAALRRLDYPRAKLDIKLLLEEHDTETIEAAKAMQLESIFELVRVPASQPQTKPKACNYGLHFARGEFVTIYDAEDKPEPDQLKKAVVAFRRASPRTACLQARLNYYNRDENWLTRLFTLEYSMWFDLMLPGLEQLRIPIPLGGTSNHFRTATLRELRAWDPYNVTEDADLGVRLTAQGYSCATLNSTTFEEANTRLGNWLRQRSRWIKGYMQTWLVHMRRPGRLYRELGFLRFLGFQLCIGATVLTLLLNPLLWLMFVNWVQGLPPDLEEYFPPWVVSFALFNLLIGNACMIYFFMLGAYRRGYTGLIAYALSAPVYWAMMSVAAYKALWQLIHNPFYWEKTTHGISRLTAHERQMAVSP